MKIAKAFSRYLWVCRLLVIILPFGVGVIVGVVSGRCQDAGTRSLDAPQSPRERLTLKSQFRSRVDRSSTRNDRAASAQSSSPIRTNTDDRQSPGSVEVVYAAAETEAPSPELTAAHLARQAKRREARAAKAERCRDFLLSLNLNLLTDDQQKNHSEFLEALSVRDAVRAEMAALREGGGTIPDDLLRRLSDAESVVRSSSAGERRAIREAAARAHGLDETAVRVLLEDLDSVDSVLGR